ncbi:MAG TPA: hypothetical protein VL424_00580, partial [Pararobbsia sp.]|nr:hypothetical protein [Pararobbsia sp.]
MLGVSANTTMCRPAATGRRNEIESTSDLANERIAQTRVDDSTPHESGNLPGDSCALCDEAASNRAKQILWITEHYFSRGWVELGALRELMKSSPRLKARYEALVTRDSEAQSVMKEPLRALCRVTKLPLSEAIDWVTNNPSGALQGRRLTFSQQRALLELMAKPPVEQTLGMFAKAGVLDPSVKVVRLSGQVASGASYDFELLLSPAFLRAWDEPCESLVERMNAGSFRDLIVDHYLRCAEPGFSNPRSNPLVLMLCADPRLFPCGVERRRWIGLRGADLGDGRGEFGFGFQDGAPLLDSLKRDEILAKWLEHGSFPRPDISEVLGESYLADLVNYRYSRIEGGACSLI